MPLYLVAAPEQDDVLSLDDAKRHLRVDFDEDDELITSYIAAAVQNLDGRDGWLGRALAPQTWDLKLTGFCGPQIVIPLPPLIEVQSVSYHDMAGEVQTLATSVYEAVGVGGAGKGRVALRAGQRWPSTAGRAEAVVIRFRAGYVTADDPPAAAVPAPIVTAIRRQVASMYEHREAVVIAASAVKLPGGVEPLLAPYRVW